MNVWDRFPQIQGSVQPYLYVFFPPRIAQQGGSVARELGGF